MCSAATKCATPILAGTTRLTQKARRDFKARVRADNALVKGMLISQVARFADQHERLFAPTMFQMHLLYSQS
jgi:hypothetical protein